MVKFAINMAKTAQGLNGWIIRSSSEIRIPNEDRKLT